jgi:myo-inositol 2-dehydrogenase/D-chiro-inositol 1-dehydrogenase
MKKNAKGVGLAIIGAGRVGLFRGEVAARHPAVEWIGIAELNHNRGGDVAARIGADFVTTDYRALLGRPEVTAAIIATDEHLHVDPILAARLVNCAAQCARRPIHFSTASRSACQPRQRARPRRMIG